MQPIVKVIISTLLFVFAILDNCSPNFMKPPDICNNAVNPPIN